MKNNFKSLLKENLGLSETKLTKTETAKEEKMTELEALAKSLEKIADYIRMESKHGVNAARGRLVLLRKNLNDVHKKIDTIIGEMKRE